MPDATTAQRVRQALTAGEDALVDVNDGPREILGLASGHPSPDMRRVVHRIRALAYDTITGTRAARWLCGATAFDPVTDPDEIDHDLDRCQRCEIRHYPGGTTVSRFDHLQAHPAVAVHEAIERHLHELGRSWRLHANPDGPGYVLQHRERISDPDERKASQTKTAFVTKGGPYASLREFARSVGIVDDDGNLTAGSK